MPSSNRGRKEQASTRTLVYVGWIKCPLGLAVKSVRRKSVCRKNRKLIVQVQAITKSVSPL